jgi:hypothetical protein
VNLLLDELLRRVVREAGFREAARAEPHATAGRAGVPLADLTAVLDGELVTLHERGAHPLLIMHLAGALGIDPMETFGRADEVRMSGAAGPGGKDPAAEPEA